MSGLYMDDVIYKLWKCTSTNSSPYCFFCSSELSEKNDELWKHDKLGDLEKNPLMPVLH